MMEYINYDDVVNWLPVREKTTYKNKMGHCLLIGGNENKGGAIIMAALSAVKSGAGLTTVATAPENHMPLLVHVPEAMYLDFNKTQSVIQTIEKTDTIVIGPGLGTDKRAEQLIDMVLKKAQSHQTIIMDADALTLYSLNQAKWRGLTSAKLVMTPHAGEWERIMKKPMDEIKHDEEWIHFAKIHQAYIIAKGAPSYVITKDQRYQNTTGNPSQAVGGMGDTLTGIIASFIGQFSETEFLEAILSAVYIHSYTADQLAKTQYVTLPTEVSDYFPLIIREMIKNKS